MKNKGYTLIEILIVITILAGLAGITLAAINPAKQIEEANNSERQMHANAIEKALSQYQIDNKGRLPATLEQAYLALGSCPFSIPIQRTEAYTPLIEFDICDELYPAYLSEMPLDPKYYFEGQVAAVQPYFNSCEDYFTGYTLKVGDEDNFDYISPPTIHENRFNILTCKDFDQSESAPVNNNIVASYDFESATSPSDYGDWRAYGTLTYFQVDEEDGNKYLRGEINGVQLPGLELEGNTTYTMSFDYRGDSTDRIRFYVNLPRISSTGDIEALYVNQPRSTVWRNYSRTFTTPEYQAGDVYRLFLTSRYSYLDIDNFTLTKN